MSTKRPAAILVVALVSVAGTTAVSHAQPVPQPVPQRVPQVTPQVTPRLAPQVTPQIAPQIAPLKFQRVSVAPSLKATLASKRRFDPAKLATFVRTDAAGPVITRKGRDYRLMRTETTTEKLTRATTLLPKPILTKSLTRIQAWRPGVHVFLPTGADHRSAQSPVRDQGARGTCSAFATVGGLEGLVKRRTGNLLDFSENHVFNRALSAGGSTCTQSGGVHTWRTVDAALDGVCAEGQFAYTPNCPSATVPQTCSQSASTKMDHVFSMYTPNHGVPDVAQDYSHRADNVALLESFLDSGVDIVFAVDMAGTDWGDGTAETGTIDVQVDAQGNPADAYAAHAILMVGYNSLLKYFIFKNSWGADNGHDGYVYLSHDYVQTYAWYGFAVLD